MRKGDKILIAALAASALAWAAWTFCFPGEEGAYVRVRVDGKTVQRISLQKEGTYPIEGTGGENTLEIKNGEARMVFASCPDQICVKTRAISKQNEQIVCLPNRVVVECVNGEENGVDSVAG